MIDHLLDEPCRQSVDTQISSVLLDHRDALHIFPLGIGGHVDHILVRDFTARRSCSESHIAFYEELPYACRERVISNHLLNMKNIILPVNVEAKVNFMMSYQSQQAQGWINEILLYMLSLEEAMGVYAERIWQLNSYQV